MAGGHFGVVFRRVESLFQAGDVAGLNEAMLRTSPTAPDVNRTAPQPGNVITPSPLSGLG